VEGLYVCEFGSRYSLRRPEDIEGVDCDVKIIQEHKSIICGAKIHHECFPIRVPPNIFRGAHKSSGINK
jgi:hypothetical protein